MMKFLAALMALVTVGASFRKPRDPLHHLALEDNDLET